MNPDSIRTPVLLPLALVLGVLLGALVLSAYLYDRNRFDAEIGERMDRIEDRWRSHMLEDCGMMSATLTAMALDEELRASLGAGDREILLQRAEPLFRRLLNTAQITHMYFTGANRVNILRVHKPDRHGDLIERITTLKAESTGRPSWGMELGPLGTLTLRVVHPWFDDGQLIGYVELGHEAYHMIEVIDRSLGVDVFPIMWKEHLDRDGWLAGMQMLGRRADWDSYPDSVAIGDASSEMPEELSTLLSTHGLEGVTPGLQVTYDDRRHRIATLSLTDVGDREVGLLVAALDTSQQRAASLRFLLTVALAGAGIGGLVIAFFFVYLSRVQDRLDRAA